MTPYERDFTVTTTESDQIVALDYPGRCTLDYVAVLLIGSGTVTADIFNRAFTGPITPIYLIANADGSCMLQTNRPLAVREGDPITVASSPHTDYNTTHRIVQRLDDHNFITDQTFVVEAVGGTAQLDIPSEEQELYRVTDQLSDSSPLQVEIGSEYVNRDALGNINIGVNRKIYFKLASAGTYRITLRSHESIGVGGS